MSQPTNDEIAAVLERIADLLDAEDANVYRVLAYRTGASTVRSSERPIAELVGEGPRALKELPGIGDSLAGLITEYVHTGRSNLLAQLEGEVTPEDVFMQVPGIGKELAKRITNELDIHSLEELERAAHDGRLDQVEGFGPQRVENVRVSLAGMLSQSAARRAKEGQEEIPPEERPDVATLLEIDAKYREGAEEGELERIAPRRFNPDDERWLPIMHENREGWRFTALYSNTKRAHELDKTHDWVVIYYEREGRQGQATVVTASSGPLRGKRVVRGRELESRRYYAQAA